MTLDAGDRDIKGSRRYITGILLRDCDEKKKRAEGIRKRLPMDPGDATQRVNEARALDSEAGLMKAAIANAIFDYI